MIFRPFYYYDLGCASYLLGCGTVGQCARSSIRAPRTSTRTSRSPHAKKMQITQVIDTHVHADHRSGGVELAKRTGAPYRLHESADVDVPFTPMRDGEEIDLGNTRMRVLHTPGHSPESVSLLVTDLKRGTEPWFVLTGDTLFVGAVGRPDLPGQRTRERRRSSTRASTTKLLTLPDDLEIYPGHFSGSLCGAGLSGKPSSTIAFERRWNPMLSLPSRRIRRGARRRAGETGRDGANPGVANRRAELDRNHRRDERDCDGPAYAGRSPWASREPRAIRAARRHQRVRRRDGRAWSAASCRPSPTGEFHLAAARRCCPSLRCSESRKRSRTMLAGRFADRLGRKPPRRRLDPGDAGAVHADVGTEWAWVLAANALLGHSQGLTLVNDRHHEDRSGGPKRRGLAMGLTSSPGTWRWPRPRLRPP